MKLHIKIILSIFLIMLVALIGWGIYLAQISPEAEAFFYGENEEERKAFELRVQEYFDKEREKIKFIGDLDLIECPKESDTSEGEIKLCTSTAELKELLQENEKLFSRYQSAKHDSSINLDGITKINGSRLFSSYIQLLILDEEYEHAVKEVISDFRYWNKTLNDKEKLNTFLDLAILLFNFNRSQSNIAYLLNLDYRFSAEQYYQLSNLLKPISKNEIPIKDMLRFDFYSAKSLWARLDGEMHDKFNKMRGRLLNKNYMIVKQTLKFYSQPNQEICKLISDEEQSEKDNDSALKELLLYGPFAYGWISFSLRPNDLAMSVNQHNTKRKLLQLMIKLREENINTDQINAYIESHPEISINPQTLEVFEFNPKKNVFIFKAQYCDRSSEINYSFLAN